jgi:hypothetical protein
MNLQDEFKFENAYEETLEEEVSGAGYGIASSLVGQLVQLLNEAGQDYPFSGRLTVILEMGDGTSTDEVPTG